MPGWYVVIEGKPKGPYTEEELKQLPLAAEMFVRKKGMDDYKEAHEVPELRELLGFKKRTVQPQYFATLDLRLLAVMIDLLLVSAAFLILAVILILLMEDKAIRVGILLSGIIVIPLIKILYAWKMEGSSIRATFGKKWLGIKVCAEDGLQISSSQAIIRNLAGILSLLTLGIGYLMGFFDKKQQCLHDKVAGTLVIKDRLI